MPLSIEAEQLGKKFGSTAALTGATFRFDGVGAIGYLGPNGAGKTTTLKLLTRLLRPTTGHARINGTDVTSRPKAALWDVGAVIESPDPYPQQTGREALEMVGEFRGLSSERLHDQIERYAKLLELPPLERRTGKLSKGQRQRIVLASALISEPAIILLDEPTSGLDPAERVIIRNLLVELKRERLILMSSHLLPEVTEICDRVIFVNEGRIVAQDTVAGLAGRFKETQIDVEFVAAPSADRLASLAGLASKLEAVGPSRYRLTFDGSDEARTKLLVACQQVGAIRSFASSTLSLEDAYLKLMRPDGQRPT
ncbi:MAG: ABC transporter ATP-binding protein [Thermoplasmata archaeon]|nr:ABC transporter ATP-binding protein [Thermoplasmata archaeon]